MDTIEINGTTFSINKTGLAQAVQVQSILRWLGKNAEPVIERLTDAEGNIAIGSIVDLIKVLSEVATVDSMLSLYEAILGCDRRFAEENWTIDDFIMLVEALWNNETYRKVVNRFFSRE